MTDLPDRILEAIAETARDAQHALGDPWVARKEPLDTLRRCEADTRTVQRHAPERIKDRYWCTHCERLWPCVEILDRADAYGIAKETGDQT